MKSPIAGAVIALCALAAATAHADLVPGLLSDFESGSTENWMGGSSPTNIATGGPAGVDDNYLQIGNGGRLAVFNSNVFGAIDPSVVSIQVDMLRPSGEDPLDMRLVLFGPSTNDRWTSTTPHVVPGDGQWNTYTFSLLEADLTEVHLFSEGTYEDLLGALDRIMFRYDPGEPSAQGVAVPGTLGIDNVIVLQAASPLDGDANGDGKVDILDLDILSGNFGTMGGATVATGDFNGDGNVDILDLDILSGNFGTMASASAAVPEPAAALVALVLTAAVPRRKS